MANQNQNPSVSVSALTPPKAAPAEAKVGISDFDFASRVHAASVSPVLPCPAGATPAERARVAIEFVRTVQQALDAERT